MPETQTTSPKLDLTSGKEGRARFGASRASDKARPQQSRRERIVEGLKTLLWVAPLTALIWIWAEREQLATGEVQVPVKVTHVASDRVAIIESPVEQQIYLELSGPRASIDAVRDRLAARTTPLSIPVDVAAPFDGEVIGLAEIITRSNEIFTRNAVTVTRARPSVKIRVEKKRSVEVPVQVKPEDKPNGTVTFEPDKVFVEGPATFFKTRERELAVYADMGAFLQKPPGQYQELVSVNLDKPAPEVTIRPPRSVTAKVQIAGGVTKSVTSLRAFVVYPVSMLEADTYKVEFEANSTMLGGIEVSGPPDLISEVGLGKRDAYVQLVLTPAQWTMPGRKTVEVRLEHYKLPKEITVLNPDRTVTITLTPRSP